MTSPPSEQIFRYSSDLLALFSPSFVEDTLKQQKPIPTNEWWGNLLAFGPRFRKPESDPVFLSPYTVQVLLNHQTGLVGFSTSYLHQYFTEGPKNDQGAIRYYYYPAQIKNLILSAMEWQQPESSSSPVFRLHHWDDLGVHIQLEDPSKCSMKSYLSHGSAFMSVEYADLHAAIQSDHAFQSINGHVPREEDVFEASHFAIQLNNNQRWVLFFFPHYQSSGTVKLSFRQGKFYTVEKFTGLVQMAFLSNDRNLQQDTLVTLYRRYAGVFPTGGQVVIHDERRFDIEWQLTVLGENLPEREFLCFGLEHHKSLLMSATELDEDTVKLWSHTRGRMVPFVVHTQHPVWRFEFSRKYSDRIEQCVGFFAPRDISDTDIESSRLCAILQQEIESDWKPSFPREGSYYFKGKALQKYGSMCLLARKLATKSETMKPTAALGLAKFQDFMMDFVKNASAYPLVYDTGYRGIISSEALSKKDINVDFGNAVYNDHHYHFGYYIVAAATLLELDPEQKKNARLIDLISTLIRDVMSGNSDDTYFPKYRHFDWFNGHSYSHGVTPLADGKDEESTSEEVNFFYGVSLFARLIGNQRIMQMANLALKLNTTAIKTYFLISDDNRSHPATFRKNKVSGVFFDNKCDCTTWFSAQRECIHGIQMLPVTPILEVVREQSFVAQEWDQVLSKLDFVSNWQKHANGWTSLLFANYSVLNAQEAVQVLMQCPLDDGLSRAWALYFACTRPKTRRLLSHEQKEHVKVVWLEKFHDRQEEVDALVHLVTEGNAMKRKLSLQEKIELVADYLL